MKRSPGRRATAFALLIAPMACYVERPVDTPVPQPATRIVAEVTDSGTVVMGRALGSGAVGVEAIIAEADADTWKMLMIRVDHRDGRSVLWNHELVSFPRYALTSVSQKKLDKARSWVAAGAITASAILAAGLFKLVGSDEVTDNPPPPVQRVTPGVGRPE